MARPLGIQFPPAPQKVVVDEADHVKAVRHDTRLRKMFCALKHGNWQIDPCTPPRHAPSPAVEQDNFQQLERHTPSSRARRYGCSILGVK